MKFAKYHALRIVKAIKSGEDPNASNPKIEEAEEKPEDLPPEAAAALDAAAASSSQAPLQPRVEDASEDARASNPSPNLPQTPTTFTELPSAPQRPASTSSQVVNPGSGRDSPLNLPSAPNTFASSGAPPNLPDTPSNIGAQPPKSLNEFHSFPPPSATPPAHPATAPRNVESFYNAPSAAGPSQHVPSAGPGHVASYSTNQPTPIATPPVAAPPASAQANHNVDDQAISQAQKHARWAVSALTFDDVNTAIKELRNSLQQLGA